MEFNVAKHEPRASKLSPYPDHVEWLWGDLITMESRRRWITARGVNTARWHVWNVVVSWETWSVGWVHSHICNLIWGWLRSRKIPYLVTTTPSKAHLIIQMMYFSWRESNWKREVNRYLSLTQFEGHTGSYELHFFTSIYKCEAPRPWIEEKETRCCNLQY